MNYSVMMAISLARVRDQGISLVELDKPVFNLRSLEVVECDVKDRTYALGTALNHAYADHKLTGNNMKFTGLPMCTVPVNEGCY
ncbi:MAG: hypothetical protein JRM72_07440 [Nitrososphaerota archaeon]|jgi:hypothetical protein|nr:hypothetical protein [Nitrososphaerota archaeon]MDG7037200.1 hypothetical protein [Nitrososphaerota archaeon]